MPTIRTTETTASSAKRVRAPDTLRHNIFRPRDTASGLPTRTSRGTRYANFSGISIVCVSSLVVDEIRRIVKSSEIMKEDDSKWPQKNKDGRQELEIRLGNEHISFEVRKNHRIAISFGNTDGCLHMRKPLSQTAKIGSLIDVTESADPEGLRVFYYLVQDLKALVFSLTSLHFKIKPIS